jgi:hypothetical protein
MKPKAAARGAQMHLSLPAATPVATPPEIEAELVKMLADLLLATAQRQATSAKGGGDDREDP